jgi:hypothetical protein
MHDSGFPDWEIQQILRADGVRPEALDTVGHFAIPPRSRTTWLRENGEVVPQLTNARACRCVSPSAQVRVNGQQDVLPATGRRR